MARWVRGHRTLSVLIGIAVVFVLVAGGYGTWLAGEAGRLPWQEDPTRIPITPFADIPGFSAPAPPAVATPGA